MRWFCSMKTSQVENIRRIAKTRWWTNGTSTKTLHTNWSKHRAYHTKPKPERNMYCFIGIKNGIRKTCHYSQMIWSRYLSIASIMINLQYIRTKQPLYKRRKTWIRNSKSSRNVNWIMIIKMINNLTPSHLWSNMIMLVMLSIILC